MLAKLFERMMESPTDKKGYIQPGLKDLPTELLLPLFEYLDKTNLLNFRTVNNTWKNAVDEVLGKRAMSQSSQPGRGFDMGVKNGPLDYATWASENLVGTWFTSNEAIEEFLDNPLMQFCTGNPFPGRTIIIYTPGMFESASKLPARLHSKNFSVKLKRLQKNLERLFNRLGEEIWTCYLIIPDEVNGDNVGITELDSIAKGLPGLKSFSLFHKNWTRFIQSAPVMSEIHHFPLHLDALQILGQNALDLLQNLFRNNDHFRAENQIKSLRIGPNVFRPIYQDRFQANPYQRACKISDDNGLDFPASFAELVPEMKKLVLEDPCAILVNQLKNLERVQEFSAILSSQHSCSPNTLIPNILNALDEGCSTSLRKLHFRISPGHFRRVHKNSFLSKVKEIAGQVEYCNVKDLSISFSIIKQWPVVLDVLVDKCPNLKNLTFHGYIDNLGKILSKDLDKKKKTMPTAFDSYCRQRLFRKLPASVMTISVPSMGLFSNRNGWPGARRLHKVWDDPPHRAARRNRNQPEAMAANANVDIVFNEIVDAILDSDSDDDWV